MEPQIAVKLLCVTPFSWLYGEALSLLQLVTSLDRKRFDPYVITTGEGPLVERLKEAEIPTESIHMPYLSRHGRQAVNFMARLLPISFQLAQLIRKEGFELVYNNTLLNPYGAIAAALANTPCVWHVREVGRDSILRKALIRFTGLLSTRVVVVSHSVSELYRGNSKARLRVVYNGIDTRYFDPALQDPREAREEFAIKPSQPVIAFVGRLHPSKHHHDALKAVAELKGRWPDLLLLIVGDGPEEEHLRRVVEGLGLEKNTRFAGYHNDVRTALAASDVLVLPSEHEAFGRVVIEAMAMEKPVVATNVGGLPELITPETGRLVPVGDCRALAEALTFFLEDPERTKGMGKVARQRVVMRFSIERYVEGMVSVFDELV